MKRDNVDSLLRESLRAPTVSFWRPDGDAIVWRDGVTITFREEIAWLLARFTNREAPRFDALLLVLAALRESWGESRRFQLWLVLRALRAVASDAFESVRSFLDVQFEKAFVDRADRPPRDALDLVEQAASGLDAVHRLARAPTPESTLFLLESFFEEEAIRAPTRIDASDVARALRRGLIHAGPGGHEDPAERFFRGLAIVLAGVWRFLGRDLELERETGMSGLPRAADVELSARDRVRALLDELSECERLAPIASLCRRVMAATHVPRDVSSLSQLPTGGLSDIANTGRPERLLPTELAHDDLTLATRIVLNEALYYRRETSRRRESRRRAILLDNGIRLWGRSRVFAASVALALAATADATDAVDVWSHDESGPRPEDVTTRAGLLAMLGRLGTDAHPGASIAEFVAADRERHDRVECIVITHELGYRDENFTATLEDLRQELFIATVSEDGAYRLRARTPSGTRVLQEARIR